MSFPIDIPIEFVYVLAAVFWIAVLLQWSRKQRRMSQVRATETCRRCKEQDLHVDIQEVNKRNGHSVSLLKNVWGCSMLLTLAGILLWSFALFVLDLTTGSNDTGIQGEDWKLVVALLVLTLVGGALSAAGGIRLLLDYVVGGTTTLINVKCNDCGTTYVLE